MDIRSVLATPLAQRLGITWPIFGFAHSVDVVVEVCCAGGLGVLGATRMTPEEIGAALKEIRARVGARPFGVDLVLPQGMPARDDRAAIEAQIPAGHRAFVADLVRRYGIPTPTEPGLRSRFVRSAESAARQLEAVLASDVNILALGIGSPAEVIARAHETGLTVVSLVGSPEHARRALKNGADILVAQGYDAGAHTGPIGTFSLVPQVVDIAGSVPVVAAGGVATGRHLAAAFALGAQAVWMGTAWLVTRENHTDPLLLKKLLAARSQDTVVSRADSGKPLRQIRTAWSDEWARPEAPEPLPMPYQDILVGDVLGAIDRYRIEPLMHSPAGQSIGYFSAETTVADVMQRVVDEAAQTLTRLGRATWRADDFVSADSPPTA
jgi:NAD(P)H-dependent flavin oxidoreductase YrpB (nitropropane dioxygenase family)